MRSLSLLLALCALAGRNKVGDLAAGAERTSPAMVDLPGLRWR